MTSFSEDPNRTGRDSLSIAFSALAFAAGGIGLAYLPGLLTPSAVALALAGVLTSNYARGFAAAAAVFAGLAWVAGMTIALFTHHPLF